MPTRRCFLQHAGIGAAAALTAARAVSAQEPKTAADKSKGPSVRKTIPFELGIATYSFRKFPYDKVLTMATSLGIKHLCLKSMHLPLDATPEVIAQTLAKAKAVGIDIYGGGVFDMDTPAQVKETFDYAKAAGMRVMVSQPLPEVLPLVNEKVQEYDIRLAIHNHGHGDIWASPLDAYKRIKDFDRRVGLCMDIGHTVRNGDDLCRVTEQVADRLYDMHMKDETAATMEGQPIEVGRGVIDIPAFLRTLVKIHYSGFVSFEYEKNGDDPLPGLAESVGYVRGVMAAI